MVRKTIFDRQICSLFLSFLALLSACNGGSERHSNAGVDPNSIGISCDGSCADASGFLTAADVEQVIARAVFEAQAQGTSATIAVVDRVGNVLGVFRMTGADQTIEVNSGTGAVGGLEEAVVPDTMAAIAKGVTAAYLSTEGSAFSTRTANQIVQEHFNPGERDQPSGPLFGVQFSQLPCSDVVQRFNGAATEAGPKRSPLGLAADAGGFPLYKGGTVVGGVGVIADGLYGIDRDLSNFDRDVDEIIGLAATYGLAAPPDRRADVISAAGKFLRFSDVDFGDTRSDPAAAPLFSSVNGIAGELVPVFGYYPGANVSAGTPYGQPASGVRPDLLDFPGLDAFVLVDRNDAERFRPRAGTEAPGALPVGSLTEAEVREILSQSLAVANSARAQIRRPLGSPARVTITVVDTNGAILGVVRGRDAPVFGFDVSAQKARTAAFFSGTGSATAPGPALRGVSASIADYVAAFQGFLSNSAALESAGPPIAFSNRAIGNLSRPRFPDGPDSSPPGPFSKSPGAWSVFSTGLQVDLSAGSLVQHVLFVSGSGADVAPNCTTLPAIANGIQIFPGSVPIYRGSTLVGAIGTSGDGVDQDDMIAFLGVSRASAALGGSFNHAPVAIRADHLTPRGVRLRYISCPQAPFNDSDKQNVCEG